MSEKEEIEKSMDFVTDQERDYAQNALNEFNKYVEKNFCKQFLFNYPLFLEAILRQVYKTLTN